MIPDLDVVEAAQDVLNGIEEGNHGRPDCSWCFRPWKFDEDGNDVTHDADCGYVAILAALAAWGRVVEEAT